ncbi:MAG: CdaR family protein, partial [Ardenticatenaceae bacterium]
MRDSFSWSNTLQSLALALVLALLVWITAANNDLTNVTNFPPLPERGVLIELRNIPPGLVVTEGEGERAVADLLIATEVWPELAPDDLVAYVDLAGLEPGRHQLEVQVERQPLAPRFRLLSWTPNRITVRLDEEISRALPIEVVIPDLETIAPNYRVITPTVEPPTITITGPTALVEPVERVVAEVEVDGSREPVTEVVEPVLVGQNGTLESTGLTISTPEVEVNIPVEQKEGYRELIVRTMITGTSTLAERGYWISRASTQPTLLTVVGQRPSVDTLDGIVATDPIDVSGLEQGSFTREVPLQLPEGVSPLEEGVVTVTIEVEPQTSSKTITLEPQVVGLEPGLVVTDSAITPPMIDVLLQGPINELENLTLDEVVATLDLTGKVIGSYLLEPRISTPGTLQAESVIPAQVEVTVAEARERRDFSVPVEPRRLPANTYAAITPDFVTVTLEGPLLQLEALDPDRLQ